jgi:lipid A 3-O-deacylase
MHFSNRFKMSRLAAALPLSLLASVFTITSHAADTGSPWTPDSAYVQYGQTTDHTRAATVGLTWDWQRHWALLGGSLGGYWEVGVGQWRSSHVGASRESRDVAQLVVRPTFRFRTDNGASPWFWEAAIGLTVNDRHYENEDMRFSTRWNFADHIAVGRNFGDARQHELALRLEHYSNAGIRKPNPGEDFLQLRYAFRF